MSRKLIVGTLIVIGLAISGSGWALAQQEKAATTAPQVSTPAENGPFAVSPAGDSAILLDTSSGKTWALTHSIDGKTVCWLPVKRFDSDDQIERWKRREEQFKERLAEQEEAR